ncbi:MAG TPA: hypothetical protein VGL73_08715 [Caulobacteraceae bacterium]
MELSLVPLRLGPIAPPGFVVRRSGMRWLREDGALCRAGEAIAYCNIGLIPVRGPPPQIDDPFSEEHPDLQVALASRISGRLRRSASSSRGGFLDTLDLFQFWEPDFVLGHMERLEGSPTAWPGPEDELELLFVAGRRQAQISEGRQGLLTGWHNRTRAWRAADGAPLGAVLGLGICDMAGVIRGESNAFLELFEAIGGPAHAILSDEEPLMPSARIIIEQTVRSKAQYDEIAADLIGYFAAIGPRVAPSEWIFLSSLLQALRRAPLAETHDILSRTGLSRTGPADAVVLSAHSEAAVVVRHRRLGYTLRVHGHRLGPATPNVEPWLRANFDWVERTLDDIAKDYRDLVGMVRAEPERLPRRLLIMNRMASTGDEDLQNYAGFDVPMASTLSSIFAQDLNLLLHDLAREPEVDIVDVDAITAEMGGQINMPDNVHTSGALQAEVRGEVLHILNARGVPGFGPASG